MNETQKINEIINKLSELGGGLDRSSDLTFEGTKYIGPADSNVTKARQFYVAKEEELLTQFSFTRQFDYRPWDGAYAFKHVCEEYFGGAVGKATRTMFGSNPPEMREIEVGWDRENRKPLTDTVPWGLVKIPALGEHTTMYLHASGVNFAIEVEGQKKDEAAIRGLFELVDQRLRTHSIYRGQAVAVHQGQDMTFIDPWAVDRETVIYNQETLRQLDAMLWWPIRESDQARRDGLDLKRTILLEGPYGTGKTLATNITAQECVENGWTCVVLRPGADLVQGLELARTYGPAVLVLEDIDTTAQSTAMGISKLLDTFDGFETKGTELMVLATTNHADRIPKGMCRPGRINAMIHVGPIDQDGMVRFAELTIPDTLLSPNVDWKQVWEEYQDYLPAFIKEGMANALMYARSRGAKIIGTEELVESGKGLRRQWEIMDKAEEGIKTRGVGDELIDIIRDAIVDGIHFEDSNGYEVETTRV